MTQRVLVTGAQGFIGRWLVGRWLAADPAVEIVGIGRSPARPGFTHAVVGPRGEVPAPLPAELRGAFADPRYQYHAVDLFDGPRLAAVLQQARPDVVVHLAARLHHEAAGDLVRTNVEGTARLLDGLVGAGLCPRVVLGSSAAAYGAQPPGPWDPARPDGPATSAYGASRQAAEGLARLQAARHGLPLCVARIFNPIGPGLQASHLPGRLAAQLAAWRAGRGPGLVSGPLTATRDYVDVRDVADDLRALAAPDGPVGVVNVASGRETPVSAVLDALLAAAGDPDVPHAVSGAEDHSRVVAARPVGARRRSLADSAAALLAWHEGPVADATPTAARPVRQVSVRATWSYPVEVGAGLLQALPARLGSRFPGARAVLLTDSRVWDLYGGACLEGLRAAGVVCEPLVLPEGEPSKALGPWQGLIQGMHARGFRRRSVLVCLGGGLITDVGGFAAATYMRGVPYVNVPTTLLAQHDSAIGGKVAVNAPWAKNFVGAFHHPAAVYCDPEVLRTLEPRDISAGVAEALKVALTGDRALFELLEDRAQAIRDARDAAVLAQVVGRAADRKIALLDPDPYEVDLRRALNLGHSLAHPLETAFEYEGLRHGEAVGFGLAVAVEVARGRGAIAGPVAERIHRLLSAYDLPPALEPARCREALEHLPAIRMVRGGSLHFVMPVDVDAVTIVPDVGLPELGRAVDAVLERA